MEFRFHCLVVRHASGRVTVLPMDMARFNVHALSLDKAMEDLQLALDDKLARVHPRHLGELPQPRETELLTLEPQVLPVWTPDGKQLLPLRVTALKRPAHGAYVEVRIPRVDLRLWFPATDDVLARATEMLRITLLKRSEQDVLDLRIEDAEELGDVRVDVQTTALATLDHKQVLLDERPAPRPKDEDELDEDEKDDEEREPSDENEEYDDQAPPDPKGKKRKRPPTPTLKRLGDALHELAQEEALERAYHVDKLVTELLRRVEQKKLEPVVLVGPAGVGKTAIIHELAHRLAHKDQPPHRRERPFFHVGSSRLIAGQGFFGDWQQQTYDVMEEARKARVILHLGHVVELLDAGKSAHSDQNAAQILAPLLAAQKVAVIGEATPEEWARLQRVNQAFASVWSVLRVDEPPLETARSILRLSAGTQAARVGIAMRDDAVDAALGLTRRFWPYGSRVGNTVTFLRRLIASRQHAGAREVTRADALAQFSSESGIPEVLLRDDLALKPEEVRAFLAARVMGQSVAVGRVTEVVSVVKAGLMDERRPMAVLFFAGPTGVGKTELSKALAEFIFGSRDRMVRLDMGEYSGPDAIGRLVGEYDAPGHLTAAVRRQPFSLVLLDEIEKAHPAVFDAMLGLLGEGRLTDAQGRFTDFRNAIIIMTSNLGAETVRSRMGFSSEHDPAQSALELRRHYRGEAERFFRPELFNRIDDFVVFMPLEAPQLRNIVTREVQRLAQREGIRRHNVVLQPTEAAMEHLLRVGLDPRYGARPLKRAIERELVVPVGAYLSSHPGTRMTRISVDVHEGALSLQGDAAATGTDAATASATVNEVLNHAAELRSRVRRLRRTNLALELRQRVAYFDRASREKSFWAEGAIAEQQSTRASAARELLEGLMDLERQAETTEDLAFEAFYDRSVPDASHLHAELTSLDARVGPMAEQLYGMMFPPRSSLHIYLTAGRGAFDELLTLANSYFAWCSTRKLEARFHVLEELELKAGEKGPPKTRWYQKVPSPDGPRPVAVALVVSGPAFKMLLTAEHGAHRFTEGGQTSVVKVRVEPGAATLKEPKDFLESMPADEVRRVSVAKKVVRDYRTNTEHPMDGDYLPMRELLADWMEHRLHHADAEPWG
ncbi:MAG: AAA family ATPase [Myxococcota bacterium]